MILIRKKLLRNKFFRNNYVHPQQLIKAQADQQHANESSSLLIRFVTQRSPFMECDRYSHTPSKVITWLVQSGPVVRNTALWWEIHKFV